VEATIRSVESNPGDHSVGYGGQPNILGGDPPAAGRAARAGTAPALIIPERSAGVV
jgi:hypothetical protein